MADLMPPERLAEIRERAESVRTWKAVWSAPVPQLCDVDIPDLLAEVKRLRHDLDVQRAAMATMLADERQMQAAHDRTRAERDDYRARLVATDRAYAEQAARADAAERERDQMAKRIEQGRQAAVVYAGRIAEVEAERDRLAEQVKRVEALRDRWEAAVRDPSIYRNGGVEHAAALAASHLPDLRAALDGAEPGQ